MKEEVTVILTLVLLKQLWKRMCRMKDLNLRLYPCKGYTLNQLS